MSELSIRETMPHLRFIKRFGQQQKLEKELLLLEWLSRDKSQSFVIVSDGCLQEAPVRQTRETKLTTTFVK